MDILHQELAALALVRTESAEIDHILEPCIIEKAEDEQRWQRYLSEGRTIPFEAVRGKLHGLAAEAAGKADPH